MRADRQGPVIGKAMEPFDGSEGWEGSVRVLVAPAASSCADGAAMAAKDAGPSVVAGGPPGA